MHDLVNGGRSPHSLQFQAVKKVSKTPPTVREWARCFVESASISSPAQLILLTDRNQAELERHGDMDAAHRHTGAVSERLSMLPATSKLCQLLLLPKQVRKTLNLRDVERRPGPLHAESAGRRGELGPAVPGRWMVIGAFEHNRGSFADHLFSCESWHDVAVVLTTTVPRNSIVWVM